MSSVPAENIALHVVRDLMRGLGKAEGQGISMQSLRARRCAWFQEAHMRCFGLSRSGIPD